MTEILLHVTWKKGKRNDFYVSCFVITRFYLETSITNASNDTLDTKESLCIAQQCSNWPPYWSILHLKLIPAITTVLQTLQNFLKPGKSVQRKYMILLSILLDFITKLAQTNTEIISSKTRKIVHKKSMWRLCIIGW